MRNTRKMVFMAVLTSLGVVLGIVDRFISAQVNTMLIASTGGLLFIPHLKFGLANIVVMISLYNFNGKDSFLMVTLKSLLVSLILGALSTFIVGYTGSVLSFLVMWPLIKLFKTKNTVMISVIGSFFHLVGQMFMSWQVSFAGELYSLGGILVQGVMMLPVSIITGILIGMIVKEIRGYLERSRVFEL